MVKTVVKPIWGDQNAVRKSKIRLRINSFSAVIIPYIEEIVKSLLSTRKNCGAVVKENARHSIDIIILKSVLEKRIEISRISSISFEIDYSEYNNYREQF